MVGNRLDVPCAGIGESPSNQTRGVSAILLLNQAAVQAVIVLIMHATPSGLLGIKEQARGDSLRVFLLACWSLELLLSPQFPGWCACCASL